MAASKSSTWFPPPPWAPPPTPAPIPPGRPTAPATARPTARPTARTPRRMIETSLRDAWFVLGVRGSGKTKFSKRLVRELRSLYPAARLYVLDSKGDHEFDGWPGLVPAQEPPPPLPRAGM